MSAEKTMNIGPFIYTQLGEEEHHPKHDYLAFYKNIFPKMALKKYPYYRTLCPFHDDKKTPNLNINIISGRYNCFACGKKGGSYDFMVNQSGSGEYHFRTPEYINDQNQLEQVLRYEQGMQQKGAGSPELVLAVEKRRAEVAHEFLFRQPLQVQALQEKRGLTIETIKKWQLGFMHGTITIPVPDIHQKLATLKFHKKMLTEGMSNQLFPWEAVFHNRSPYVILIEGEFDMFLLRQLGFNAVTQIWGANAWDKSFTRYFRGKTVYLAYDNDEAGREAALRIAHDHLWNDGTHSFILQWPHYMQDKEDHCDFFIKYRRTVAEYQSLLSQSKSIINLKSDIR